MGVVAEAGVRLCERFDVGVRAYRGLQDVKDHSDGFMSPLFNDQLVLTVGYVLHQGRKRQQEGSPVEAVPAVG
ncbi:MAG: hypothetical protein KF797_00885 [Flavobacteriales bacterium]|nr:hypothetical protein [Flavobacteriales bacterium]